MGIVIMALQAILGLAGLVCLIFVLIEMFKDSIVQGIIGLICGLWAFIWGWMHRDKGSLGKIMPIWTIVIIAIIALNVVATMMLSRT